MGQVAIEKRAADRDARERGWDRRYRVCMKCVRLRDEKILGACSSLKPCQRCGAKPCIGAVVEQKERA
jgi:translation initiation factor 2 beta subunit (eIF-2beta)/eIF-5